MEYVSDSRWFKSITFLKQTQNHMIIGDACCFKHWPLVGAVEHPTLYINIPHFVYIVLCEKKVVKKIVSLNRQPPLQVVGLLRGDDITVTGVPLTAAELGFFPLQCFVDSGLC